MNPPIHDYVRSGELLSRAESRLLIVDIQEKLLPAIPFRDDLVSNCGKLLRGAAILGVPAFATEQYPQGLGATIPEIAELLSDPVPKVRFSCAEALNWGAAAGQTDGRYKIVVGGMEAHVCVLQTVLDLVAQGFQVFVPADAIASRKEIDYRIAIDRMAAGGATITTWESVLFEWCEVAGTPEFKQISKLIKGNGQSTRIGF